MLPQPSPHPDINQSSRRWPKRHRRLISRRRAVSASFFSQLIDPLNNTTSYQYDSVGNLTQKTNPNNTTISYQYDANNRLIEKTTPEGTTSYQYDQNNNLTTAAGTYGVRLDFLFFQNRSSGNGN